MVWPQVQQLDQAACEEGERCLKPKSLNSKPKVPKDPQTPNA